MTYMHFFLGVQRGRSPVSAAGSHGGPARPDRGRQGANCRPQAGAGSLPGTSNTRVCTSVVDPDPDTDPGI